MCIGFFQKGETRRVEETNGGNRQKVKFTPVIEDFYDSLLKLGYLYKDLYEMTIGELAKTIECRRKGLAYELWKQANLNTFVNRPDLFPDNPEKACPELYPPPKTYKMPEFLKKDKKGRR